MVTYVGTAGDDGLVTGAYTTMYGLDGNDFILTTESSGEVDGGAGNDIVSTVGTSSVSLYGGDGNDVLVNDGGTSSYMYGGHAGDLMVASNFSFSTNPNGGAPTAIGTTTSNDNMYGGDGSDAMYGFAGNDVMYGGGGSDSGTIAVGAGPAGFISGYIVHAGLYGGDGADYLDGGQGNDYLDGGNDDDYLIGGQGGDIMYGGSGSDTIIADSGFDTVYGGDGTDSIYGGRYIVTTDHIVAEGGNGNDYIFAGDNIDVLYGDNAAGTQTGDDFLWAGGGNDYLIGGNGTDTLIGNYGSDFFYGGAGLDYFDLAYDVNGGDADYLLDFQAGTDYVLLQKSDQNDVTFGVSGGYAYGYITEGTGSYLFLAAGLTAAQLQASTLFVL